jgi:YVTN family beta-propeller protein
MKTATQPGNPSSNNRILVALVAAAALFAASAQSWSAEQEPIKSDKSLLADSAPTSNSESGFVYAADERGNAISVIKLGTGHVKNIATRISPHNVQISPDGRLLFVVGSVAAMKGDPAKMKMGGDYEMARGRLLILDTKTMAVGSAIDIEVGHHPAHVVVDAEGKLAYVTNSDDDDVLVVDVARKSVINEIKTGKSPHGLRMSLDGRELYVANANDDSVSVIDIAQSREVKRIPVGKAPVQVGFTPDGLRAYVSLRDENGVAVIDTMHRAKIATVAVGRNPIQVFATPDGKQVYVANQGTDANPDNTVSVIDTRGNTVVSTIVTGKGAHGVVVSADGKRAFVTNIADDSVSVIDTATQKVINQIKVGKGPNGITFRSDR